MTLYIVRHGQSVANADPEREDDRDPVLSPLGAVQADLLAKAFANVRLDRVYSSHMTRAAQTAAAVLRRQADPVPLRIVPELTECGTPADFTADEEALRAVWPDIEITGLRPREFGNDRRRAEYCIGTLVRRDAYERGFTHADGEAKWRDFKVMIVAHGVINAHLAGVLANFPFDKNMVVSQANTCVDLFELYTVGGARRVKFRKLNDVSHLPPDLVT